MKVEPFHLCVIEARLIVDYKSQDAKLQNAQFATYRTDDGSHAGARLISDSFEYSSESNMCSISSVDDGDYGTIAARIEQGNMSPEYMGNDITAEALVSTLASKDFQTAKAIILSITK